MPEERKKKKMKRGLVLGAQYDDSYGDGNQRREYMNTITDPDYPFTLKRFQIKAALKYIRWCEQSGTSIPQNWRLFKLKYKRNTGVTIGDLWREVQEEREAETNQNTEKESETSTSAIQRSPVEKETGERTGKLPEGPEAEIRNQNLFIRFHLPEFDPNPEYIWSLVEVDYLRIERDGKRYRYSELYPGIPTMKRYSFPMDPVSADYAFVQEELDTIVTLRLLIDENSYFTTLVIILPLQFEDGSTLSIKYIKEKPGIIWREGRATVRPAETDYATLTGQIIDAMNGITTYNDSELIFTIFQNQDDSGVRTLLSRLKKRSAEVKETPDSVVQRLFDELSANHREGLKDQLIALNVVDDLVPIVAGDLLKDPDSEELNHWLDRFHGMALDRLLQELEKQSGKTPEQTLLLIFENLDTLPAEKVRAHFFTNGTPKAADYALEWTVIRINNLLEGYTGILDSGSIVWNFRHTPENKRRLVLERLNKGDSPDIATHLMRKLQPEDYVRLQKLGLPLPKNQHEKALLDRTLEAGEWGMIASQTVAGGLVGIVHGGVDFAWDVFKGIVDIPFGIYHYFMTLLFLSSKGSIGSDSVLKVEEFIRAVDGFVGDPRAILEMAYEQTIQESETFEGTFEAFQRSEYWGRLTTKFILTVITIVKGIQAARKGVAGERMPELERTGRIDKDMEIILGKARKREKEPELDIEIGAEVALRSAEDKKLKKLIERILKERRKLIEKGKRGSELRTLSKEEIKELINHYKIPKVLENMPSDSTLSELSLQSGVEWVAVKFKSGSVWLKTDGKKREVKLFLHKDIVEVKHTHPEGSTLNASDDDYRTFKNLVKGEKAEIRVFRIIMGGESRNYTLTELENEFEK